MESKNPSSGKESDRNWTHIQINWFSSLKNIIYEFIQYTYVNRYK
jgi:hypothetical protein